MSQTLSGSAMPLGLFQIPEGKVNMKKKKKKNKYKLVIN